MQFRRSRTGPQRNNRPRNSGMESGEAGTVRDGSRPAPHSRLSTRQPAPESRIRTICQAETERYELPERLLLHQRYTGLRLFHPAHLLFHFPADQWQMEHADGRNQAHGLHPSGRPEKTYQLRRFSSQPDAGGMQWQI